MKKAKLVVPDFAALENVIGYTFSTPALLQRAVTHRSWAHEQVAPGEEEAARRLHNEALEFLGDSVLGFIVAAYLLEKHTEVTEGELSRMKHRLVSTTTLSSVAERLTLGQFLRVGHGEEKTGGRRKCALLADVFEAILAAIFLDGGIDPANAFVRRVLENELKAADPETAAAADYKTMLQERLQAEQGVAPQYIVKDTSGPPHRRTFHVEVSWEGGSEQARGRSIKAAETAAARCALKSLDAVLSSSSVSASQENN